MGILKAISDALREKAKEEIVRYLKKIAEEQERRGAEKSSKMHERREEHKPVPAYPPERDEERRRRDIERDRHDRFERRDHHDHEQSSSERGERDDRWQERGDRYREKYRDDFRDHRDHDKDRVRERDKDRAREDSHHREPKEEKQALARVPESQEMPAAQKPAALQPAMLRRKPDTPSQQPQQPLAEQKAAPVTTKPVSVAPQKKEWIAPLNDRPIEKVQIALGTDDAAVPVDLGRMIQQLPPLEYALYLKLYLYSFSIRKNYGYVGAGLKKNLGLADLDSAEFDRLLHHLEKRGLLSLEKISEFQSTYVLYLPLDADRMTRVEEKKEENKEAAKSEAESAPVTEKSSSQERKEASVRKEKNKSAARKDTGGETTKSSGAKPKRKGDPATKGKEQDSAVETGTSASASAEEMKAPGVADISMDEDQLIKSYRTFVSMEIDKAKMRVGRSNFDKIYMEAVKYIDKKYGFKVLSDQERFREYLTQYYISAFDIPSFEEWKKTKA